MARHRTTRTTPLIHQAHYLIKKITQEVNR